MAALDITTYLVPGKRAHLVGIGGVSMAPLAEVLHGTGMIITGSDAHESATVEHLRSIGISVSVGQRAENLGDAELVIRTAAAHDSNPSLSGPKPGALSCATTKTPCASRALTEKLPPPACAPISSWRRGWTPR